MTAVLLLAGCSDDGPPSPQGSVEFPFTELGRASRPSPDGEQVVVTADEAEAQRLWRDADLQTSLDATDVTVPAGHVAVLVEADYKLRISDVVRVVEVDGSWLVQMRSYSGCVDLAYVRADVLLLLVEADAAPAEAEQEVEVLPGCPHD